MARVLLGAGAYPHLRLAVLLAAGLAGLAATAGTARAGPDGTWVKRGPPREASLGFVDPLARELVVIARAGDGRATPWRMSLQGTGTWEAGPEFLTSSGFLYPRRGAGPVFDGPRRRWIAIDYVAAIGDSGQILSLANPVSELRLDGVPTTAPIPVQAEVSVPGRRPGLALDPANARLYAVGGDRFGAGEHAELWTLDLEGDRTWRQVAVEGESPRGRIEPWVFFDATVPRLIFAGGGIAFPPHNDTWEIDLRGTPRWRQLDDGVLLGELPFDGTFVFDADHQRLVLHAGYYLDAEDTTYTWQFDLVSETWQRLDTGPGPGPRREPVFVADAASGDIWMLGGFGRTLAGNSARRVDVWKLASTPVPAWTIEQDAGEWQRHVSPLVHDPVRNRLVIDPVNGGMSADVTPGPLYWERNAYAEGARPPLRSEYLAVFDPVAERILVHGGTFVGFEVGDLWELSTATRPWRWTRLFAAGESPRPRRGMSAVYDPPRHRIVMFGGSIGELTQETWELSLASDPPRWRLLPTRGAPPPGRTFAVAVHDPRRDGMWIHGGYAGGGTGGSLLADTWFLSFADCDTWLRVQAAGTPPSGRFGHAGAYDPVRDRLLLSWGQGTFSPLVGVFELSLSGTPRWRMLGFPEGEPVPRARHGLHYDAAGDRVLVVGGETIGGVSSDEWNLLLGGVPAPPATAPGPPTRILSVAPNPSRGPVDVIFDLAQAGPVHARIYDLRGRLVRDFGERRYTAGRHALCWDPREAGLAPLRSGLYFARVRLGERELSGKIVLYE